MNQRFVSLVALPLIGISGLLMAGAAHSQGYYDDGGYDQQAYGASNSGDGFYDVARVVRVDPIYDRVAQPVSRRECWQEPVQYRTVSRSHDRTPSVVGGIIGGLIGNQFGHGRGRDAATIAGVALGASIARDEQRRHGRYYRDERVVYGSQQRCTVRTDYRSDERLSGYDVTYDYQGQIGRVRTDFDPGETIRVRVSVDALPYR